MFRTVLIGILAGFYCSVQLKAQNISINEVLLMPSPTDQYPWIELKNSGLDTVNLSGIKLSATAHGSGETANLPEIMLLPNQYVALELLSNEAEPIATGVQFSADSINGKVYLVDASGGLLDSVVLVSSFREGESYGRFPEHLNAWVFFDSTKVTKEEKNSFPGAWSKLTNSTSFSPRDSSPNACLVYKGKFWIFEGWEYKNGTFASRSNIWVSEDMVNWRLVNDNPPYYPYSAYVVYKDKMWVFDDKCWSSTDGVTWVEEADYFPGSLVTRVTVLRDTLWFAKARSVGYSVNGTDWFFTTPGNAPWDSRDWPGFQAFDNKLWFFGGGNIFSPSNQYYFNDIWVSENGADWTLVTDNAPWPGRFWFSSAVFDDKLWLFGGYDVAKVDEANGNMNDIWYTTNGTNWTEQAFDARWRKRHAQITFSADTAVYICCGYSGGGPAGLNHDVWKLSMKAYQPFDVAELALQYGDEVQIQELVEAPVSAFQVANTTLVVEENNLIAKGAGHAWVRLTSTGSDSYYPNDTIVSITVDKRPLVASVGAFVKKFGDPLPPIAITYDGLINGDTPDMIQQPPYVTESFFQYSPVGTYDIPVQGGFDENYEIVPEAGTLVVEPDDNPALFPNPATQHLYIFPVHCSADGTFSVKILNETGGIVKQMEIDCTSREPVNLDDLPSGLYIAQLNDGNSVSFTKVLVIR